MQKYPKGTLVEIVRHDWRPELVGKRFVVDVTKVGRLSMGKSPHQNILENVLIYMTPFPSVRPERAGRSIGLPEGYIKPVDDVFPEDEGFEFDESKIIWKPTVVIEDGEALVV